MKKLLILAGAICLSSGAAMAASCSLGIGTVILSSAAFSNGQSANTPGFSCSLDGGAYTFSNFAYAANAGFNGGAWQLTVGSGTTDMDLDFGQTVQTGAQDGKLTFQISTGVTQMILAVGPGGTVSEVICSVGTNPNGTCQGATLGVIPATGPSAIAQTAVIFAPTDFVFKDVGAVSEFAQGVVPEPMTFSLLGAGLLGLGLVRRKLKK